MRSLTTVKPDVLFALDLSDRQTATQVCQLATSVLVIRHTTRFQRSRGALATLRVRRAPFSHLPVAILGLEPATGSTHLYALREGANPRTRRSSLPTVSAKRRPPA